MAPSRMKRTTTQKGLGHQHRIVVDNRSFRSGGHYHENSYYTCEVCGRTVVLMFIDPHGAAKAYYRHLPFGVVR